MGDLRWRYIISKTKKIRAVSVCSECLLMAFLENEGRKKKCLANPSPTEEVKQESQSTRENPES